MGISSISIDTESNYTFSELLEFLKTPAKIKEEFAKLLDLAKTTDKKLQDLKVAENLYEKRTKDFAILQTKEMNELEDSKNELDIQKKQFDSYQKTFANTVVEKEEDLSNKEISLSSREAALEKRENSVAEGERDLETKATAFNKNCVLENSTLVDKKKQADALEISAKKLMQQAKEKMERMQEAFGE